jgi:hypothetical protein
MTTTIIATFSPRNLNEYSEITLQGSMEGAYFPPEGTIVHLSDNVSAEVMGTEWNIAGQHVYVILEKLFMDPPEAQEISKHLEGSGWVNHRDE